MRTLRLVTVYVLAAPLLACGGQQPTSATESKSPPKETPAPATSLATSDSAPASEPTPAEPSAPSVIKDLPDIEAFLTQGSEVAGPADFAYTFEKGKSSTYQLAIRWRLKGKDLPLGDFEGAFSADLGWEVKDVAADGTAQVEVTYKRIQAEFNSAILGGVRKTFDSQAEAGAAPDPLLAPFGKMVGKTFSLKVSKQGTIAELGGQDQILDEALSDASFPSELRAQIKAAIGERGLSQLIGSGLLAFPQKPLAKGDEFESGAALTVPGLGEINLNEKIKLADIREIDGKKMGIFSISVFALVDPQGAPSVTSVGGVRLIGEATPTIGEGWFAFDLSNGIPSVASLPLPLLLKISFVKEDGSSTTPTPIEVVGEVAMSAQLLEE